MCDTREGVCVSVCRERELEKERYVTSDGEWMVSDIIDDGVYVHGSNGEKSCRGIYIFDRGFYICILSNIGIVMQMSRA